MTRFLLVVPFAAALALTGCAHKKATKDDGSDRLSSQNKEDMTAGKTRDCSSLRVHFGYDSAEISDEDKAVIQERVECMRASTKVLVSIEGNTDERGTEEYNMALGDRRAATISKYMRALGADGVRLKTVSFGEEKPVCDDSEESCWKQNRRAAVKLEGMKSKND